MNQKPADGESSDSGAQHPRRKRLFLAGGATIVAVCAVAVLLLLSSGQSNAFAGWTATPSPASPATLATARRVCGKLRPASVIAAESRGPFTAIAYKGANGLAHCVTNGRDVLVNELALPPFVSRNIKVDERLTSRPAPGHVALPVMDHTLVGAANARLNALIKGGNIRETSAQFLSPESLTVVSGATGSGVRGVTFVLVDGASVRATVSGGRYLAWWPETKTSELFATTPAAILVTTAEGTKDAPYSPSRLLSAYEPCFRVLC